MGIGQKTKRTQRTLRHRRVRAMVHGTAKRPRASVYRSNQHIHAQLIDDENATTLFALSDLALADKQKSGKTKTEVAALVGRKLGEEAAKKGIGEIVFDRGGFRYHGRVRAVAEGLREAGIKF